VPGWLHLLSALLVAPPAGLGQQQSLELVRQSRAGWPLPRKYRTSAN
jgi:hypothetical protein